MSKMVCHKHDVTLRELTKEYGGIELILVTSQIINLLLKCTSE